MTDKKYKHQLEYAERNKDKIALYAKKRYLDKELKRKKVMETLSEKIVKYINKAIIDESEDWYLKIDSNVIRGYNVEIKFKTILYLLMIYKHRIPLFYQEFKIKTPVKRTQGLKEKLIKEYSRIYKHDLKILPFHPREYLERIIEDLNLTDEHNFRATQIISKTREHFRYTNPKTYLGSIIYHVTKGTLTQKDIADYLEITPNGIRGIHRKLKQFINS